MPTSPYAQLDAYIHFLKAMLPESILDIGLGNGKLGFIARDLLDVMIGERYKRAEWKVRIDGIEVFGDYVQDHQRAIYDGIHIGDAFDTIDTLGMYDVVVLGDVLEHFPKEKGWLFLDKCFDHAHKAIILFLPLGSGWIQGAIYDNPYETHRSSWEGDEMMPMSSSYKIYKYAPGFYGAFLIEKENYLEQRIEMLKTSAFLL